MNLFIVSGCYNTNIGRSAERLSGMCRFVSQTVSPNFRPNGSFQEEWETQEKRGRKEVCVCVWGGGALCHWKPRLKRTRFKRTHTRVQLQLWKWNQTGESVVRNYAPIKSHSVMGCTCITFNGRIDFGCLRAWHARASVSNQCVRGRHRNQTQN